jgi:hypothetical protein
LKNERYYIGFRKTVCPRNDTRKKGSLPFAHYYYYFISLSTFRYRTMRWQKIPSVGRAFYDSHGVFRSLYPFLTTLLHRYNPTLNPCIMCLLKINTIKKKHNVRCKIKFPNSTLIRMHFHTSMGLFSYTIAAT